MQINDIRSFLDLGLAKVISLMVILLLYKLIKGAPKWIPEFFNLLKQYVMTLEQATEETKKARETQEESNKIHVNTNNIQTEVVKMLAGTKEMHIEMDTKIEEIFKEIADLKNTLEQNQDADVDFQRVIFKELDKKFEEIKRILNKDKEVNK